MRSSTRLRGRSTRSRGSCPTCACRSFDALRPRILGRAIAEPLGDPRHVWLERAGHAHVERTGTLRGSVLEVVFRPAGSEDERSLLRVDPPVADKEAHRAFDHVEDVVLFVRM